MLRRLLMLSAAVISAGVLMVAVGDLLGTTASAAQVPASSACQGAIQITHLAFNPKAVPPGGSSTVHLTAVNCTGEAQQTTVTWFGKFTGGSGGSPEGCPEIDPFGRGADFSGGGTYKSKTTYDVPSGCDARDLRVTVRISKDGTVLAQRSADLTILIPGG